MIKINWEELAESMEDYTNTNVYILNKQTGAILILSEYMSEDGKSEIKQKIRKGKLEDYIKIPTLNSREGYKMMESFIATLQDEKIITHLKECLANDAPFKQFKEIVFKHPEVRKHWFDFKQKVLIQTAKKWLDTIGVKYV